MTCDRCKQQTNIWTMSMFNTDVVCMVCKEKEEQHPEYENACAVERREVEKGNYRFPGVGLPNDLR